MSICLRKERESGARPRHSFSIPPAAGAPHSGRSACAPPLRRGSALGCDRWWRTQLQLPHPATVSIFDLPQWLLHPQLQPQDTAMANGLRDPPCGILTADAARSLVDSVDAFLFDCDGVIWKGDKLIEGVPETMELLRKMGKKLVFVTNNSRKSRRQYSKKFRSLGLEVTEEEIFTSSFAAAMFLKLNNFPPEKKVYVVGEDGILEELKLAGFECFGGPEDGKKNIKLEADFFFEHDKSVGAVVVGLDQYFNYYKMQYARICISENPGCLFIATNRDPTGHMTSAQEWPGAGTMVAAVSCSVQKEPIVVGKPSSFLMDFLLKSFNLETSRMCMVGDRLDTDILFGQNTGCKTLLVLSGCTALSELQDASNNIHPDLYMNSVHDLFGLLQK